MVIISGRLFSLPVFLTIYLLGHHTGSVSSRRLPEIHRFSTSTTITSSDSTAVKTEAVSAPAENREPIFGFDNFNSNPIDERKREVAQAEPFQNKSQLFALSDANNDGKLTPTEYEHFMLNLYKHPEDLELNMTESQKLESIMFLFNIDDADGNGYITVDEI